MSGRIVIEAMLNYHVWFESNPTHLVTKMNVKEFKNKKEVLAEVEKLLPELKKYEDPLYGKSSPNDDHDDHDD